MNNSNDKQDIQNFWSVGVNYKKTDASVRGLFAINNDQYGQLLNAATEQGLSDLFIISTCNRTEIYGFADSGSQLAGLICSVSAGDADTFDRISYSKSGYAAIEHLFQVGAGLDSQILGDYEILGQIKNAVKFAKGHGFIGAFMERLVNCVLQASKAIKTHTALSSGTVSVSFAAVQYIKDYFKASEASLPGKKIVLIGTGKIGKITCRNLVDYLGTHNITLINRTEETAAGLANELGLRYAPIQSLGDQMAEADIILVSTSSEQPIILKEHLEGFGHKLIVDLSVPSNVACDAQKLANVSFVNVDRLSEIKDETLQHRKAEVPKALSIIDEHIADFRKWYDMRRNVPVLKAVKQKLEAIHIAPSLLKGGCLAYSGDTTYYDDRIQKVISSMASRMRMGYTPGCHYIQAINEYIG